MFASAQRLTLGVCPTGSGRKHVLQSLPVSRLCFKGNQFTGHGEWRMQAPDISKASSDNSRMGVAVRSSSSLSDPGSPEPSNTTPQKIVIGGLIGAAVVALGALYFSTGSIDAMRKFLGTSGFSAAFALIFVSEIGDKTFFIAALLAMEFGRWLSFTGTMASLSLMTVISVAIGALFRNVPDALKTSAPVGEWLSVAMLLWFGVRTLQAAFKSSADEEEGDEMQEAQEEVEKRRAAMVSGNKSQWAIFLEVASLIFVAEWGDRSMLATVALGAAQNVVGVTLGAVGGHAVATFIAVLGGSFISRYISERTISIIGGSLFIVFAAATAFGLF